MRKLRAIDLFCGAGGFSHGFVKTFAGKHLAIDINPIPLETLTQNQEDDLLAQLENVPLELKKGAALILYDIY